MSSDHERDAWVNERLSKVCTTSAEDISCSREELRREFDAMMKGADGDGLIDGDPWKYEAQVEKERGDRLLDQLHKSREEMATVIDELENMTRAKEAAEAQVAAERQKCEALERRLAWRDEVMRFGSNNHLQVGAAKWDEMELKVKEATEQREQLEARLKEIGERHACVVAERDAYAARAKEAEGRAADLESRLALMREDEPSLAAKVEVLESRLQEAKGREEWLAKMLSLEQGRAGSLAIHAESMERERDEANAERVKVVEAVRTGATTNLEPLLQRIADTEAARDKALALGLEKQRRAERLEVELEGAEKVSAELEEILTAWEEAFEVAKHWAPRAAYDDDGDLIEKDRGDWTVEEWRQAIAATKEAVSAEMEKIRNSHHQCASMFHVASREASAAKAEVKELRAVVKELRRWLAEDTLEREQLRAKVAEYEASLCVQADNGPWRV